MKGMNIPEAINPLVYLNLEDFDQSIYDSLPEFLRNKIADSKEFKAIGGLDEELVKDIYN
jgi:hypothetical protein